MSIRNLRWWQKTPLQDRMQLVVQRCINMQALPEQGNAVTAKEFGNF